MKKSILLAIAVFAFGFANAQEGGFKLGAHAGLPMGDSSDFFSVNLGVDVAYTEAVSQQFSVGLVTGYSTYLGKEETLDTGIGTVEIKADDYAFIPLAATGQYSITENLFLGADLGYAIYVGSGEADGGFLYQPKFGYQTGKMELYAAYKGIAIQDSTVASLNLGFNYKF